MNNPNVKYKLILSGRRSGKSFLTNYFAQWNDIDPNQITFENEIQEIEAINEYDRLHDQIDR